MLELADVVKEVTGSTSQIVFEPLPVDDPTQRQPDITLARTLLGWEPKIDLREGLARTADVLPDEAGRRTAVASARPWTRGDGSPTRRRPSCSGEPPSSTATASSARVVARRRPRRGRARGRHQPGRDPPGRRRAGSGGRRRLARGGGRGARGAMPAGRPRRAPELARREIDSWLQGQLFETVRDRSDSAVYERRRDRRAWRDVRPRPARGASACGPSSVCSSPSPRCRATRRSTEHPRRGGASARTGRPCRRRGQGLGAAGPIVGGGALVLFASPMWLARHAGRRRRHRRRGVAPRRRARWRPSERPSSSSSKALSTASNASTAELPHRSRVSPLRKPRRSHSSSVLGVSGRGLRLPRGWRGTSRSCVRRPSRKSVVALNPNAARRPARVDPAPGLAVRLRRVPPDLALEPGELDDQLDELLDRHLPIGAEVHRLGAVVPLGGEHDALGGVVDVEELSARRAGAPDLDVRRRRPPWRRRTS